MALKATVFKVDLQVNDLQRHYYQQHSLTIARHPSETDERMMLRVLAFALFANEDLRFTKGLCADDEPDLWQQDLSGSIVHWIDLGLPEEKRVRKACHRADKVTLIAYGGRTVGIWWEQQAPKLRRFDNLRVVAVAPAATCALAAMVERTMCLQCTIDENHILVSGGDASVDVQLELLKD